MDLSRNFQQLRVALPLFSAIAVVVFLYNPSIATLWDKWTLWDQDLAHSIPTIAVMLALLARKNYRQTEPTTHANYYWLQILGLAACSLSWYLFESLSISLPAYFALMATLGLFISASTSPSVMWSALPCLGLLLFTIPIWSDLSGLLVKLASTVVGYTVKMSQITVLLDGSSLFLPSGTIYIADGCSGIRYFIIALLMGYILILLNQYKWRMALATIIIAATLGLLANWLRIYLLVLIGYHTEMQSSLMRDHETFGWIVFASILIPAIYFSPVLRGNTSTITIPKRFRFFPLVPLAIGPLLLYFNNDNTTKENPLNLNHLTAHQSATSQLIGTKLQPGIPLKEEKFITLNQLSIRVDLFINTPQSGRDKIVPFIGGLTDGSEWQLDQSISSSNNFKLDIHKKVGGVTRVIIAKQYIVGAMKTDSYWKAKLMQIIAKASNKSYFGLLTAQANCKNDCTEEIQQISQSLITISPQ
ncbi:MAG: archaeosortase/exosortase family protein [Cellvibrio sp.]|uniref:archaeosortase/exosortase family protein n=1 Tax=Cellvibrio sp. TaxID=1965322 RepID=UPI0031A76883